MHPERNVEESFISMFLDFTDFTKDNINVRKDLAYLCDHPSLEAKASQRGNMTRPQALYCLKLEHRKVVLKWLKTLKFLDHYAFNIKRAVNITIGKLNVLKSHDYPIIIERLMLVI
jgi:hypothetical protein